MQLLHDAAELQPGFHSLPNRITFAVLKNLLKGSAFHIFHDKSCEVAVFVAYAFSERRNSGMMGDIPLIISAECL